MKKLIKVSKLTYSEEFFSRMNSAFENWVIAIIGTFILFFAANNILRDNLTP